MIRRVEASDAAAICGIYNGYVASTRITFEERPVTVDDMTARIGEITGDYPWLVFVDASTVAGYTYASRWKDRSAYRYAVEAAIYLAPAYIGKGIGGKLLAQLLRELRSTPIHTVICGIALPNAASIALCEKFGFQKVAQFKEVGYKMEQWVDVGYWELVLDHGMRQTREGE